MKTNNEFFIQHDYALDKIYLKELGVLLDYASIISVKNWCKRHNVKIYKDGQKRYIQKYEYNRVTIEPQIEHFKEKYGDKWKTHFELAKKNELQFIRNEKEPVSFHNIPRYIPKSDAARKLVKFK
uniref:hypothetical protein n=1 Tax=uncultured Draconibacterium sp. TaxID=1573823 RepID=UPI00321789A8